MDAAALLIDAFLHLGIQVREPDERSDRAPDLVLDPDGIAAEIQVKRRSLVTEDVATRLLAEAGPTGGALVVVADRVTNAARGVLTATRGGYLDLRGRMALRAEGLVIDTEIEPVKGRAPRSTALSGAAGLEIAAALLMQPGRKVVVRELARELGRSPSTVSEVLAALRTDGLTDAGNGVAGTELFWRVADHWPAQRVALADLPARDDPVLAQPLRLGFEDIEHQPGWALTDSVAAVAYGAPLAFRSNQVHDFFVPDLATLRRAITLLGPAASSSQARATVRVAPVPAVVHRRERPDSIPGAWPLAHPLFVALDLAQDTGRGREILDAWTPDGRWTRVW